MISGVKLCFASLSDQIFTSKIAASKWAVFRLVPFIYIVHALTCLIVAKQIKSWHATYCFQPHQQAPTDHTVPVLQDNDEFQMALHCVLCVRQRVNPRCRSAGFPATCNECLERTQRRPCYGRWKGRNMALWSPKRGKKNVRNHCITKRIMVPSFNPSH